MMGQCRIFVFSFKVRCLVFLQRTMKNDESNALPCSKRAFSDVLDGVNLRKVFGVILQTQQEIHTQCKRALGHAFKKQFY